MASNEKPSPESTETVFKNLYDNIDIVTKQIKGGQGARDHLDTFSSETFWNGVDGVFKKLSGETTKLSLAFSKKPFPSTANSQMMVVELEKAMLALTSIFYSLPLSQGRVLRRNFQRSVVKVLESLLSFSSAILDTIKAKGKSQRLVWTGGVWEATGFSLDKENKTCVLKELKSTGELVEDALGEIGEARESEGHMDSMMLEEEEEEKEGEEDMEQDGTTWSQQERLVVDATEGLVKASKTVLKKCSQCVQASSSTSLLPPNPSSSSSSSLSLPAGCGEGNNSQNGAASTTSPSELDSLVDLTGQVSERVDQTVCCIYAPINYTEISTNGKHLADLIQQILQFLRSGSLTSSSDVTWLDFLDTALEHNLEKLRKSTLPDQGHG